MTVATLSSLEPPRRLNQVLHQLAVQVRRSVPTLHSAIQHGGNDCFPWWIVGRFTNGGDDSKAVDVSIECQGTPEAWTIRADVARADGYVMEELPPFFPDAPANGNASVFLTENIARRLQDFLSQQVENIVQTLA